MMQQRLWILLPWTLCYYSCTILQSRHGLVAAAASNCPSKDELNKILQLDNDSEVNEEDEAGWGFVRRNTFRASTIVQAPQGERTALSAALYYYYTAESSTTNNNDEASSSRSIESLEFILLQSDQTLNYHIGNAVTIFQIDSHSTAAAMIQLGPDVLAGDVVQWTIPAGTWYALVVNEGATTTNDNSNATGAFALIGSVVAPGWEAQDQEVANTTELFNSYPEAAETISSWLNDPTEESSPGYCDAGGGSLQLPTVDKLVDLYGLEPHPEGGNFLETYRSTMNVVAPWGNRSALTAIYYLMVSTEESGKSNFHRLKSDETWSYYFGDPILLYMLNADVEGDMETIVLGNNLTAGEMVQYTVPAGVWFGAEVLPSGSNSYAFGGTHVGPGFEFADWELGSGSNLAATYPKAEETIRRLTPPPPAEEGNEVEGAASSQEEEPVEQSSTQAPGEASNEEGTTSSGSSSSSIDPEINSASRAFATVIWAAPCFAATVLLA